MNQRITYSYSQVSGLKIPFAYYCILFIQIRQMRPKTEKGISSIFIVYSRVSGHLKSIMFLTALQLKRSIFSVVPKLSKNSYAMSSLQECIFGISMKLRIISCSIGASSNNSSSVLYPNQKLEATIPFAVFSLILPLFSLLLWVVSQSLESKYYFK